MLENSGDCQVDFESRAFQNFSIQLAQKTKNFPKFLYEKQTLGNIFEQVAPTATVFVWKLQKKHVFDIRFVSQKRSSL